MAPLPGPCPGLGHAATALGFSPGTQGRNPLGFTLLESSGSVPLAWPLAGLSSACEIPSEGLKYNVCNLLSLCPGFGFLPALWVARRRWKLSSDTLQ